MGAFKINLTPIWRLRDSPALVILLTLLIFSSTLALVTCYVRHNIRDQIARRDGEILLPVTSQHLADSEGKLGNLIEEPAYQLGVVLQTSRLIKGVMMTRLFDAKGNLQVASPPYIAGSALSAEQMAKLQKFQPMSQYRPHADLQSIFEGARRMKQGSPLLAVTIPLCSPDQKELLGIAEFLIDGAPIAQEFKSLDWNLFVIAAIAYLIGGSIIVFALSWTFSRLQKTKTLLNEHSEKLLQANQELVLSAKTSAVGAVAAHLIHDLKSPIFGLQSLVDLRRTGHSKSDSEDWQCAGDTADRLQNLVSGIVSVLKVEEGLAGNEVSQDQLLGLTVGKIRPLATKASVQLRTRVAADAIFSSRVSNLTHLILLNLLQNAIEATSAGKSVILSVDFRDEEMVYEIEDQGPGLPAAWIKAPFSPKSSTKKRGTGLGLAITKQLANHLGVRLEVVHSDCNGSKFALILPAHLISQRGSFLFQPDRESFA